MKKNVSDTIFSLATLPGRSGVAVIRVSGPQAIEIARQITGRDHFKPRHTSLSTFMSCDGGAIDEGLLIFMPGPSSFTGEDCVEFQIHGSLAVIEGMSVALHGLGARQAEAGEFTRRAFENARLDLTEAEGLADLIDAETESQRRQALRQMQGGLKDRYEQWRESLLDGLAQIEGEIDFPDEADVPDSLAHTAEAPLKVLLEDMIEALSEFQRGERVRQGLEIAIIGAPNAGKSSVVNYLAKRDVAIVTDIAGTTRDILETNFDIGGLPVRVSDTAGLRDSQDVIEAEGIKRGLARAKESDLRILVHDGQASRFDKQSLSVLEDGDIILVNKSDLSPSHQLPTPNRLSLFSVSVKSGAGFDEFNSYLEKTVIERFSPSQNAGLTRARHRDCVSRSAESIKRSIVALGLAPELAGDDLRSALQALSELAGETDIEAVFDRIFSRFCVGK